MIIVQLPHTTDPSFEMSHEPSHDYDHEHSASCPCSKSAPSPYGQTLDELDFERGLWGAAVNGDLDRVQRCQPNKDFPRLNPLHDVSN